MKTKSYRQETIHRWAMVESKHYRNSNSQGHCPTEEDDDVCVGVLMPVLRVNNRSCNSKEAIKADGYKVEDGGRATNDIHSEVEIADIVWQIPVSPVSLNEI